MSNVTATVCDKDHLYVRGADGREWTITRTEILAIYQTKSGSAASRRQQTITDVLASLEAALGPSQAAALLAALDFDPADSNKELLLTI